jgi:hypothetical protein
MPDSKWMSDLVAAADAVEVASLPALTGIADAVRLLAIDTAGGGLGTVTAAALKAYAGGAPAPVDTTAPTAPTNLNSSNVTQTSFTITFTPGTDNVSVARSEWSLNGTTWTAIGNATSFNVTDRTAATTYTVRVRTVDTSGNVSTAATLNVTTQAASSTPDTQAPTWLAGSISTSGVTSSGYTYSWPTATDNVGVDHYESSIDGGATWTSHAANVTSRTVTGRPASTTDELRVRAHDAAGNISNVLTATATTTAAVAYTFTRSSPAGAALVPVTGKALTAVGAGAGAYNNWTATAATLFTDGAFSFGVSPVPPDGVWLGCGTSNVTPPPLAPAGTSASSSTMKVAGGKLLKATTGTAFTNGQYYSHPGFLFQEGVPGVYNWYYWVVTSDGVAVCLNPNNPIVITITAS